MLPEGILKACTRKYIRNAARITADQPVSIHSNNSLLSFFSPAAGFIFYVARITIESRKATKPVIKSFTSMDITVFMNTAVIMPADTKSERYVSIIFTPF